MKKSRGPARGRKPGQKKETSLWIWGANPVLELMEHQPEQILEIRMQQSKGAYKYRQIEELASRYGIRFQRCDSLTNEEQHGHQGVEARIKSLAFASLPELLSTVAARTEAPVLLALDSIQDPHNLGAILRSASAAGVDGVILPKDRSAPISGTTVKTSAGAITRLDICQVTNLADTLKTLKKKDFWVYGADGKAEQSIYQPNWQGAVCLVIGGEGKGLRPLVAKQCDHLVKIPMHGSIDSLNASVASGIILFEMSRQRQSS